MAIKEFWGGFHLPVLWTNINSICKPSPTFQLLPLCLLSSHCPWTLMPWCFSVHYWHLRGKIAATWVQESIRPWSISFVLLDSCGFYFPVVKKGCLFTIRLSQGVCVITGFPLFGCSKSWVSDVGSTCFFHGFNLPNFSIWRNAYYSHVFSTEG